MNVLEKIKMFVFLGAQTVALSSVSIADAAAQQTPNYTVSGQENLTQGYVALIMDYSSVRQKMHSGISNNQSSVWRTWMDPGLKKNETLYWWLLADFLYSTNQKDEAYKALMQAFVYTKVEMAACGGMAPQGRAAVDAMLQRYAYIINAPHTQQVLKTSVLEAITRTENIIAKGGALPGMSCDMLEAQRGKSTTVKKVTLRNAAKDKRRFERERDLQQAALRRIKHELSYEKMWNSADSSAVWNLKNME